MIDFFKSIKWGMLFMSIITAAGGVMIAMNPDNSVELIIRVIGGILLAGGVLLILGYLLDKRSRVAGLLDIIMGTVMLIAGLAFIISTKTFVAHINIIFAVILGFHGLNMLIEAFRGIKYKDRKLLTTILMALICIGLAVVVYKNFFDLITTANTLMKIVGAFLILDGLFLFVVAIRRGLVIHRFNVMEREAAEELAAAEAEAAAMEERIAARAAELAAQNPTFGRPDSSKPGDPQLNAHAGSQASTPTGSNASQAGGKTGDEEQNFAATFEEIEEAIKAEEAKIAELGKSAAHGTIAEEPKAPEPPEAVQSEVAHPEPAQSESAQTEPAGKDGKETFDAPKEEKKSFIKRFFD